MLSESDKQKLIDKIRLVAKQKNGDFFANDDQLNRYIEDIYDESMVLQSIHLDIELLKPFAKQIRAVWVISGTGTYAEPITDMPGDQYYLDKKWAHGSDRQRLDLGIKIINYVKKETDATPYLIYNGTNRQNTVLRQMISEKKLIPSDSLHIIDNDIEKTLDQIRSFSLPPKVKLTDNNLIAIVSNAPHIVRLMHIYNRWQPVPRIKFLVVPLPLTLKEDNVLLENEILGVIGYYALGDALDASYPYVTVSPQTNNKIVLNLASKADLMNVFNLSNDKMVRANSFHSQAIKLSDHKIWFAKKLSDPNALMLVAKQYGQFVGQIRFDITGNLATGGISLNPKYRGKGLASAILLRGIEYLRDTKPQVKVIIANIKPQNTPSIKLFEKNGFIFKQKTHIQNEPALEYRLEVRK